MVDGTQHTRRASGYHHRLAGAHVLPLLPTGGEGWGEEATFIECPSPRPSPDSCLAGRGRKFLVVVVRCAQCLGEQYRALPRILVLHTYSQLAHGWRERS